MSCPISRSNHLQKPVITKSMKKQNIDYVWKEIDGNPNLYCWVPVSKKNLNIREIDLNDLNIQDIPTPPYDYEDIIGGIALESIMSKDKELQEINKKSPTITTLVSVDDSKKYSIVKEFIKKKGLKVYGGIAINAYLPKKIKFYTKKDIPDYDVFSPDPWNDATELADLFAASGYKYVEAKAGIHKGTYKVFVNLWSVMDITHMDVKDFEKIETTVFDGIRIVSPFKLLESLYKEFSEPYTNPARWPKVSVREKLLQKWANPLGGKFTCSPDLFVKENIKLPEIHTKLLETVYKHAIHNKLLFTGSLAYNTYIAVGGGTKRVLVDKFRLLTENAKKTVDEIFSVLLKVYEHLEITTHYYPAKELDNFVYKIYAVIDNKHVEICELIQLSNCTPYKYILGKYLASIDYLTYDILYTIVFGETLKEREDNKCKLQYLRQIQYAYYKHKKLLETDISPFQRFSIKCKGPIQNNLKVEILKRWTARELDNEKRIYEKQGNYHVIKIPIKEDTECSSKTKELCKYPCAWNKYIGKCGSIPKKTYQPGKPFMEY